MKFIEDSTEYEKLTKKIYEDILAHDGVQNIDVQHDVSIKGVSGVEHQIDVYWEYKYAGTTHKVIIECKNYKYNVSLIHARNMKALLDDIPNSSGILVTTKGYQSGVIKYATSYGIGLKLLRLPREEDWDGCIQIINIDMHFIRNHYFDIKPIFDLNDAGTKKAAHETKGEFSLPVDGISISDDGIESIPLNAWLDKNVKGVDSYGVENIEVICPESSFLVSPDGYMLKLKQIEVLFIVSSNKQTLTMDHMSFVDAVLEDSATGSVEHMLNTHNK